MSERILLVEDDESLREWISYELDMAGYDVITAADGQAGLAAAQNGHPPDLMILDIMMPILNGFEVAQALQNDQKQLNIPIIFLSARTTQEDKLTGFESGGLDYLTKPFKMKELLARVNAILRHAQLSRKRGQAEADAELQQAADIQQRLMPRETPSLPGLDLYACYKPAQQIGGDLYDFMQRPDQSLMFTAADVTGKGLPAALIMSSTITTLWSAAHLLSSPTAVLERVNTDLYDKLTEVSKFVTTFVGHYQTDTRQITYANAGHTPVVFCPAGEQAELLEADGPPLGVLTEMLSQDYTLTLNVDDVLLIGSDGYTEAENQQGEMYGYEQLLQTITELAENSAADIASGLTQQVTAFTGGREQSDDQTLLILKGIANE